MIPPASSKQWIFRPGVRGRNIHWFPARWTCEFSDGLHTDSDFLSPFLYMFFPSSLKNTFLPHVSTIFYHFGPYFLHVLPFPWPFRRKNHFPRFALAPHGALSGESQVQSLAPRIGRCGYFQMDFRDFFNWFWVILEVNMNKKPHWTKHTEIFLEFYKLINGDDLL
jgi:hypothetical protein